MQLKTTLPDGTVIVLRPPSEADIPSVYEAAVSSRNEIGRWMPWCHVDYGIADAESWIRETIASNSEHSFVLWDEAEELCLGTCGKNSTKTNNRGANLVKGFRKTNHEPVIG